MSYNELKQRKIAKMILVTLFIALVTFVLVLAFTGCTTQASPAPDPAASSATTPEEEPVEEPSSNYAFGDTATFDDGLSVSVSEGTPFTPSETSSGPVAGQQFLVFEFVITNNTAENFEPTLVYTTASSGGQEASSIFDIEQNIGFPPSTAVLPGQTIKWQAAYSVADPASITLEVSVGFEYDSLIYTNVK